MEDSLQCTVSTTSAKYGSRLLDDGKNRKQMPGETMYSEERGSITSQSQVLDVALNIIYVQLQEYQQNKALASRTKAQREHR